VQIALPWRYGTKNWHKKTTEFVAPTFHRKEFEAVPICWQVTSGYHYSTYTHKSKDVSEASDDQAILLSSFDLIQMPTVPSQRN
jgi:hypothetical protein